MPIGSIKIDVALANGEKTPSPALTCEDRGLKRYRRNSIQCDFGRVRANRLNVQSMFAVNCYNRQDFAGLDDIRRMSTRHDYRNNYVLAFELFNLLERKTPGERVSIDMRMGTKGSQSIQSKVLMLGAKAVLAERRVSFSGVDLAPPAERENLRREIDKVDLVKECRQLLLDGANGEVPESYKNSHILQRIEACLETNLVGYSRCLSKIAS